MTRAEEFEQLRALLFAIACRILGSVSEAEDAVQETWLRYEASPRPHTSIKAFLPLLSATLTSPSRPAEPVLLACRAARLQSARPDCRVRAASLRR